MRCDFIFPFHIKSKSGNSCKNLSTIEDLKVPRDREGQFHTQVFERYRRYEPHIAEGLTQMFVAGVSTRHPWEKSRKRCWESLPVPAPSVSTA
jgi:transposase-like protein